MTRVLWLFILQRALSASSNQILGVALGWRVYDLTRDPFDLGLIGLVQFLPALAFALPAGQVIDRHSRRLILRCCLLLDGFAALLLLGSVSSPALSGLELPAVFLAAGLLGVARAFEHPTNASLLPGLVGPERFPRAVAVNASVFQVATLLGPAVGGLLYALGPGAAFGVCVAAYGLAVIIAGFLPRTAVAGRGTTREKGAVLAGLAFIRARPEILGAISLDLVAVLLGGATALLPIYARDILNIGSLGLGILRAAPAVGGFAMAMLLARRPLRRHAGIRMFAGVVVFGVTTIIFALSRNVAVSVIALVLMGAGDMISVVVRSSLVQLRTPDAMRGRVSAVNGIFIGTSNQLGEFESGATAALFGTVPAAALGGIGTLVAVALWLWWFPALRRVDRLQAAEPDATRSE